MAGNGDAPDGVVPRSPTLARCDGTSATAGTYATVAVVPVVADGPSLPPLSLFERPDHLVDAPLHFDCTTGKFFGSYREVETRINRLVPIFAARSGSHGMHALAHAAVPLEFLLLDGEHFIEQIARLMTERQHQIGDNLRRTRLENRLPVRPFAVLLRESRAAI